MGARAPPAGGARRDEQDWHAARGRLRLALDLWQRSTRVPDDAGILALCDLAVIDLVLDGATVAALLKLVQVASQSPSTVADMLRDPDLAELRIADAEEPNPDTVAMLRAVDLRWVTLEAVAERVGVSAEEQRRILKLLLRCRGRDAGLDLACNR